jgi:hypothetical protein
MLEILEEEASDLMRFDLVWTPMFEGTEREDALALMEENPDPRARVWYDKNHLLSVGLGRV